MLWLRHRNDNLADPAMNDHRFRPGDRVRWDTTDNDGLPRVHYGHVAGPADSSGRIAVMFDDLLPGTTVVTMDALIIVEVTTVVLYLDAGDLLDDPSLRQALVNMWLAEADAAGLSMSDITHLRTGVRDTIAMAYALAEVTSGGQLYVLRAGTEPDGRVGVRADLPRRWELRR
jgi:hypothetical protein